MIHRDVDDDVGDSEMMADGDGLQGWGGPDCSYSSITTRLDVCNREHCECAMLDTTEVEQTRLQFSHIAISTILTSE